MNLLDPIAAAAARAPDEVVLIDGTRSLTRARLQAAVGTAAADLAAAGLAPGDVVAVMPGGVPALHVVLVLALAHLGVTQLPFRPDQPLGRRRALARSLGATVGVAERRMMSADLRQLRPSLAWLDGPPTASVPPLAAADETSWIIAHSSGTTGTPKAIAVTHAMEAARNARDAQYFRHGVGERYLTLIGTGFYNSTSAILRCLSQGGTVVLGANLHSVEATLALVDRHDVRFLQLTPSHLFALVMALPDGVPRLPRLRVLRVSSAALPARTLALTRARLTDRVHLTYGTNEAGTLAVATPDLLARNPTTVGRPLDGIDLQIVGPDALPVAAGQRGVVRVRGPGVMDAYRGDDAATRRHCRDGWFLPGDAATRDAEGLLHLQGRTDRLMNIGGVLTAPEEVEAVLLAHPAVSEAVAVAVPSERFQVIPAIAVVLREEVALDALLAHARQSLRAFPIVLVRVAAIPRLPIGKVDHPRLSRLVARRVGDRRQA